GGEDRPDEVGRLVEPLPQPLRAPDPGAEVDADERLGRLVDVRIDRVDDLAEQLLFVGVAVVHDPQRDSGALGDAPDGHGREALALRDLQRGPAESGSALICGSASGHPLTTPSRPATPRTVTAVRRSRSAISSADRRSWARR